MSTFKKMLKKAAFRAWFIVTIVAVTLFTLVTILSTGVKNFYELLNIVMIGGGPRAVYAEGVEPIYTTEYDSKDSVHQAARDYTQKICEEGIVLLKNKNNALPILTPVSDKTVQRRPKISVFGKNSVNIAYGGSGSGGANTSGVVDLYSALDAAGYDCNPTLKSFYEDAGQSGAERTGNSKDLDSGDTVILSTAETPQNMYTPKIKSSYVDYADAALVVFTRIGGEGFDLPRMMTGASGARSEDDHFLQLDANEEALLVAVCNAGFKKVVVIVNSGQPLELGFLEPSTGYIMHKDYNIAPGKIDAALWMGFPGETGTLALGNILNGSVNPSGKLADTYAVDFKKDPTWFNFGDNRITSKKGVTGGDEYVFDVPDYDQPEVPYYFVDYEEGIYVGYKYYETRGANDEKWYKENVVYPFGYGLSYTRFTWELADDSSIREEIIDSSVVEDKTKYAVSVKVKNTGSVAGRDVVQLYGHAPYIAGGIEKPEVMLLDFAKTKLLEPGEEQTVTVEFDPYYLASYDYKDMNDNGNRGYELDASEDYALYISTDAHSRKFEIPFEVVEEILFTEDPVTGYDVVNLYTDCDDERFNADTSLESVLSRSDFDGTFPVSPTADERKGSAKLLEYLRDTSHNNPNDFGKLSMPKSKQKNGISLRDLLFDENGEYKSVDADGIPHMDYDDERWEKLINQLSIEDMIGVYNYGANHIEPLITIGSPRVNCADGPVGWTCFMDASLYYDTCSYCCQTLVATTWDKEIARGFGAMVGDEGIVGNARGDRSAYSGWYAPGANIHRSPFGGRNFEYYSEDPILSGKMAAEQIKGCNSKGVFTFIKHFAVNDQETHRSISGDCSWLTEQALREIYLRPFEIAVKEGNTRAVMSSFNRIGTRWTGGDYRLLTEILRNEWGFNGTVICDFNTIPAYMNSRQMAYAGGDLNLATLPESWCDRSSAADVTVLRQSIKNILYTVGNSNAVNGEIVRYALPPWVITLIVVDVLLVAGLAVWGYFVIRKTLGQVKSETVRDGCADGFGRAAEHPDETKSDVASDRETANDESENATAAIESEPIVETDNAAEAIAPEEAKTPKAEETTEPAVSDEKPKPVKKSTKKSAKNKN
ncbi:MAG: glycoside hydrolase family 3 C-terminal domain-containing protein [Clostridia bacterium]|nr:glycoside hydrolase family 3 C-terminal domain-containing protein [Clostridia bacterium]